MAKQIRVLPIAPSSARPATFNAEADAFVAALAGFVSDANALADEAEALSRNATSKSDNVDEKYADLVTKYNDFTTKYADFFSKYDDFIPKYNEIVTKHGETISTATNHKTYVDNLKTLIDAALLEARSYINSGNGGILDDDKISKVSTWTSEKLKELIDLKADEATAYKEWNYKTITSAYTAKDNDALFIEATAPFEITLPAKGKVRIIDKVGNFATHNIKLIAGSDKFVLNKDFQRVELFFFNGKWQVVSGYLLVERNEFAVEKTVKTKTQLLGSQGADKCFVRDNLLICYQKTLANYPITAIDFNTMSNVAPALPSVPIDTNLSVAEASDELFLVGISNSPKEVKLFKFNRNSKSWQEINTNSIQTLINGSDLGSYSIAFISNTYKNKNIYLRFYKNNSGNTYEKIVKITPDGIATDCGSIGANVHNHIIYDDIFITTSYNSGNYYILECKNLRDDTHAPIAALKSKEIEKNFFFIDFKTNKIFTRLNQSRYPNRVIEWELDGTPAEVTKNPSELPPNKHIYYDAVNFTKQNAQIKLDGGACVLEYDFYESGRLTRKKDTVSGISPTFEKDTPSYMNGDKEFFIDTKNISIMQVNFTPTTFQEEI